MKLLIVTGLSGAGKSCVLNALEDMGFYCVDNLPSVMLADFIKLCQRTNPNLQKIAVAIDAREYLLNSNPEPDYSALDAMDVAYQTLFLECNDTIIERRYNETRRQHPIDSDIKKGIALERDYLRLLKDRADYILDTSQLQANELKNALKKMIDIAKDKPFLLLFESFGYKRGVPFETDMVFDMRFIKNPYYVKEYRHLTGADKEIIEYIDKDKNIRGFLDTVESCLRILIPAFIEQDKKRLMVSFGCTGGRHRSVYAANAIYERMKDDFNAVVIHRDIDK